MKIISSLLIGLACIAAWGQKYDEFTSEEEALITQNSSEMMRVYQLSHQTDSLVLKSVSKPIQPNHKLTHLLAERMLKSVQDPNRRGVGIAAPQVGINRRLILVQRFDKADKPFEVFINPEITWASALMQKGSEGDLSFEDRGLIYRHYAIGIRYQNLEGETMEEILEGFTAVIFQHERDHLDGTLLTDRLNEQKNKNYQSYTEDRLFLTK